MRWESQVYVFEPKTGQLRVSTITYSGKASQALTACLMAGYEIIPLFEHQLKKVIYMALLNGPNYKSGYYIYLYITNNINVDALQYVSNTFSLHPLVFFFRWGENLRHFYLLDSADEPHSKAMKDQ